MPRAQKSGRPDVEGLDGPGYDPDHPTLRSIRSEAERLPEILCSVHHLAEVLGASPGTGPFDDQLEAFCEAEGLEFTVLGDGDALSFRVK